MFEILVIGAVFWLGYQLGCIVTSWNLRDIILDAAKKQGIYIDEDDNLIEKDNTPNVYKLFIERVKDTLYLYNNEEEFVCQASTVEELATLAKKYNNIKYAAVLYGNNTYMFVDGRVKGLDES